MDNPQIHTPLPPHRCHEISPLTQLPALRRRRSSLRHPALCHMGRGSHLPRILAPTIRRRSPKHPGTGPTLPPHQHCPTPDPSHSPAPHLHRRSSSTHPQPGKKLAPHRRRCHHRLARRQHPLPALGPPQRGHLVRRLTGTGHNLVGTLRDPTRRRTSCGPELTFLATPVYRPMT